jgi:predicted TIM-barrel fold metal-dependent hydrolase
MKQTYELKVDAYSHIVPPKYAAVLSKLVPDQYEQKVAYSPPLYNLDARFRIMDEFEPLRQVLTLGWPKLEEVASADKAPELARQANDEMAELVVKYPDRFVSAIAILPMSTIDEALKETDRAIRDLKFRGVYIYSNIDGKPLDLPEFLPLYEKMSAYDLPIYIHPMRGNADHPEYKTEKVSKYRMSATFGWPYETTAAMTRLVYGGVLERYPNLKVVTHHCGGMVPYFAERIRQFMQGMERRGKDYLGLTKDAVDYYQMFYNDTALYGNPKALECAHDFFGSDRLLFGCDFPLGDTEFGSRNYRQTVNAIDRMAISDEDRKKIYEDNARKLMRLPV